MLSSTIRRIAVVAVLFASSVASAAENSSPADANSSWDNGLKEALFRDAAISSDASVIRLDAPKRAENPALLPLRIQVGFAQSEARYIKKISVVIDRNPAPLAGVFEFAANSGQADLELRVRLDQYSMVRAIAELNDGSLVMASRYVKGSGGCSAPAAADLEEARKRMGLMKLNSHREDSGFVTSTLRISHPNISGLQKNQQTHLYIPAHYVRQLEVKQGEEILMTADLGIAISENPSFVFRHRPSDAPITVSVVDSEGMQFNYPKVAGNAAQ